MKKALVIFSGGQDSTTCLFWARAEFGPENVEAISFYYGQNHAREIDCAKEITKKFHIPHKVVFLEFLPELVKSALTSGGDVNQVNEKGLPDSFVPNRNQLFITLAHAYAQKIGAEVLVTGVCQTDYSGYPDCRAEYIEQIAYATNLGSQSNIAIVAPLMFLTKAETFELAASINHLDTVIEMTNTCYNGDRETKHDWGFGCGTCPACELRKKGWFEYQRMMNAVDGGVLPVIE